MGLYIVIGILCVIILFLLIYCYPHAHRNIILDTEAAAENEKLKKEIADLQAHYFALQANIEENQKTSQFWVEYLEQQQKDALELSVEYKASCLKAADEEFQRELRKMRETQQEAIDEYNKEYSRTMAECAADMKGELDIFAQCEREFEKKLTLKQQELDEVNKQIDEGKSKVQAIIEDSKRLYEEEHQKDFYRLCLSESDIAEISELRQIIPRLKNPEPLNKVIWKVYYEKPYTDLIGRVVGTGVHTGIYKITNMENQMCYVGQAVNIADRWKTHIKRGMGAEPPINNKLYPAMKEFGVENFTFEIVEECERNKLNELEDYWQDFFKAKEFGYSIK